MKYKITQNNLVFTHPDKGNTVIAINRTDYIYKTI